MIFSGSWIKEDINCMVKHLSLYLKMGVQMFVCISLCLLACGRLIEIQTSAPFLMKF